MVPMLGDRRAFYEAETDLWTSVTRVNFKAVAVRKALPHVCVGEKNHDQLEEFVRMRTQTYSYDPHPGVVQVDAEESPIMQNTGVS
jgi:hypothetical protein